MATSKSGGATRLGRDSQPKYLGLKVANGERVSAGQILVRQRGTQFFPDANVGMGNDYTLFAQKPGIVRFRKKARTRFDNSRKISTIVSIKALETSKLLHE